MDSYKELQDQVAEEIRKSTVNGINKLTTIWMETDERNTVESYLKMLSQQISKFYEDKISEMIQKHNSVKTEIEQFYSKILSLQQYLRMDATASLDIGVPLNTTHKKLSEDLQKLRECYKNRKCQADELLVSQRTICEELDEPQRTLTTATLPTDEEFREFKNYVESLKTERVNRICEIANLRRDINIMLQVLEIKISDGSISRVITDRYVRPTTANVELLRKLRMKYCRQVKELREKTISMKKKLYILWDCIGTSYSERRKILRCFGSEYSQTTYDLLYKELDRCETEKRRNIRQYSEKLRAEISLWSQKTLRSYSEDSTFYSVDDDKLEGLSALDEMRLSSLRAFYFENKNIFDLIAERDTLRHRIASLEARETKPDRLVNRGGQLLKEEKERNAINKKLPKVEAELKKLVIDYEEKHNSEFRVYGKNILEIINEENEQKQSEKGRSSSASKVNPNPAEGEKILSDIKMNNGGATLSSMPSPKKINQLVTDFPSETDKTNEVTSPKAMFKRQSQKMANRSSRFIASTINTGRLSLGGRSKRKSVRPSPKNAPKSTTTDANNDDEMTWNDMMDDSTELLENNPSWSSSTPTANKMKRKTIDGGVTHKNKLKTGGAPPRKTKIPVLRKSTPANFDGKNRKSIPKNGLIV